MTEPTTEKAPPPGETVGPVLVGFDGSDGGHDALELGRVLAAIKGTRCVVATALHSGPLSLGRAPGQAELVALLGEAREALGDRDAEGRVVDTLAPGRALTECAERDAADTLVVGSPHRARLGRALLGSVAKQVLHHSSCDVVVAPRGYAATRHDGLDKIAVAFDGTPDSAGALKRAEALARLAGASIEVLVAEGPVVSGVEAARPRGAPREESDVLAKALRSMDPSLSADGRRLDPGWKPVARTVAETIAQACEPDVDLLVAGSRRPLDRALLGSVTNHLVDAAPCPVLIVPRRR